ncbi:hypothetical protein C4565_01270 [Candidatus Parcubacteria bacterium]|jgi:hypothetical protein|nr:MAG: hypothetical protein C4565_01270 [Candidatus Parcubacteria bacterium]
MEQRDPQTALADQFVVDAPSVGLPWRLMVFSIVLFVFSLFIFVGIKFGYASYLTTRQEALTADTVALAKKINPDDQLKYVNFYSQTINLKKVLDRHSFSGNIFKFLQEKTATNVYYTNATYTAEGAKVVVQGVAATSEALVQQLSVFDAAPELKTAVLTQMRFTETGTVSFEVEFVFNENFFEFPTQ